jgi:RNA polymerase sigma-70 factor (family 1)
MKTSFDSVYTNHYKNLLRFACSYVGNEMEAEDIVQDVFMHLWIRLKINGDLKQEDAEDVSYIIVAVRNKCIDALRLKKRLNNVFYSDKKSDLNMITEPVEFYETDEEKIKDDKYVECKISNAINNLPSKCRQIFIEKRINGEKQVNIAVKHNISVKTIEKQMNIAYKKLRVELSCLV